MVIQVRRQLDGVKVGEMLHHLLLLFDVAVVFDVGFRIGNLLFVCGNLVKELRKIVVVVDNVLNGYLRTEQKNRSAASLTDATFYAKSLCTA